MSDYGRHNPTGSQYPGGDRSNHSDRPRRSDRRHPPECSFNDEWKDNYDRWRADGNGPPRRDPDRDSGYHSSFSAPDAQYWRKLAQDNQEQLDIYKEDITDLNRQLKGTKEEIVNLRQTEEDSRQREEVLQQELDNVRGLRDEDAQEIDRLRMSLGEQFLRNKSWTFAIKELDPVLDARRSNLRALVNDRRSSRDAVDEAQHSLHEVELIYAKALSNTGQDQTAIDLLNTIFKERCRRDPDLIETNTRDAQRELCVLLERSMLQEHWDYALRIVNRALCNIEHNHAPAELPWIVENRLLRAQLHLRLKKYADVPGEAQEVWRAKQSVPLYLREFIEKVMIKVIHELQMSTQHKTASQLIIMTMASDSKVSDADIQSFASLGSNDLLETWAKCSVLRAAERRRVGWELSLHLRDNRRYVEAAKLLASLPPAPGPLTGPSQDRVDDIRGQLLLEHNEFSDHQKAAKLAAALFESHGFSPLPDRSSCYHITTLLTAVDKMSRLAQRRDDPAKAFQDIAVKYWQPVFQEAKAHRPTVDQDMLALIAKTGRELRNRWKDNAEAERPKTCDKDHAERKAREALLDKVKAAEGWVCGVQR